MSDRLPWYTEWNGIYMPVGDAAEAGCAMGLAMLILGIAGYLVYLFFKLIVEGIRAIGRKEWDKAFLYLAVPGLIFFAGAVSAIGGATSAAAQKQQILQEEEALIDQQQEFDSLVEQGGLLSITLVQSGIPAGETVGCGSSCGGFVYGKYELTNLSSLTLSAWSNWWSCNFPDNITIGPGEKVTIYCAQDNGGIDTAAYIELGLSKQDDVCKWVDILPAESKIVREQNCRP